MTCTASGVAAAETIDVDRLLWTPGEKTIFLPPALPVYETRVVSMAELYRAAAFFRQARFDTAVNLGVDFEWDEFAWKFSEEEIRAAGKAMADHFDKQAVDMFMAMYREDHEVVERVIPPAGESLFNPASLKVRFPRRAA